MKLRKLLPLMVMFSLSVSTSFASQFINVTSDTYNQIWSASQSYKTDRQIRKSCQLRY